MNNSLINCFQFFNERIQFNENFFESTDNLELITPFLLPHIICKKTDKSIKFIMGADLFPVGLVDVEKYNSCIDFIQTHSKEYLDKIVSWIDFELKNKTTESLVEPSAGIQKIYENIDTYSKKVNDCLLEIHLLQKRT